MEIPKRCWPEFFQCANGVLEQIAKDSSFEEVFKNFQPNLQQQVKKMRECAKAGSESKISEYVLILCDDYVCYVIVRQKKITCNVSNYIFILIQIRCYKRELHIWVIYQANFEEFIVPYIGYHKFVGTYRSGLDKCAKMVLSNISME